MFNANLKFQALLVTTFTFNIIQSNFAHSKFSRLLKLVNELKRSNNRAHCMSVHLKLYFRNKFSTLIDMIFVAGIGFISHFLLFSVA